MALPPGFQIKKETGLPEGFRIANPVQPPVQPSPRETLGNLAMEGVTSVNRTGTELFDIVTSPAQLLLRSVGFDLPTLRSTVPERGEFSGGGTATDIVSGTADVSTLAITGGGITRGISQGLDDLLRFLPASQDGTILPRVLQQLGRTTPTQDAALGAVSGAGGEIAASQFNDSDTARLAGQVVSPVVWSAATNLIRDRVVPLLKESAPSIEEIRGASRLLYAKLDELGFSSNNPSVRSVISHVQGFIDNNGISSATGSPTLATKLNKIIKEAEEGKVSYKFLDDAQSELRRIGSGTDTQATMSNEAAEMLDDLIMNMRPDRGSGVEETIVGDVLREARSLWRRASVSQTLQNVAKDAEIDVLGGKSDFATVLRSKLAPLLKDGNKKGKFLTDDEKTHIRNVLSNKNKLGTLESTLESLSKLGFDINGLGRSMLIGGMAGGAGGLLGGGAGATAALVATNGLATFARQGANQLFKNNVNYMRKVVQAGPDGAEIARAYLQNTPAKERNASDLTKLLLSNRADLSALRASPLGRRPLISDAVTLGIIGENIIREESNND